VVSLGWCALAGCELIPPTRVRHDVFVADESIEQMKEHRRQLRFAIRLHVPLATGRDAFGASWELRAWGAADELYTHFRVTAQGQPWHGGGTVGPALEHGRRLAVDDSAGRDGAPSWIMVRVAADVNAVAVWLANGRQYEVGLYGDPARFGARMGPLVFPSHLEVRRIDLLRADGELLPETR
jgi:hypothetical protein